MKVMEMSLQQLQEAVMKQKLAHLKAQVRKTILLEKAKKANIVVTLQEIDQRVVKDYPMYKSLVK